MTTMDNTLENTSGMGEASSIPLEIKGWNWGAFLLNWIWGIGNNTFIALLMFIPIVNIVMPFVLGIKGNEWAWRNKKWNDVEHFKKVQRLWWIWAIPVYISLIGFIVLMFLGISLLMKNNDAYVLSLQKIQANETVIEIIGTPIDTGLVSGSFRSTGPNGTAEISYSISGPKTSGQAYVEATKRLGKWTIHQLIVEIDDSGERLPIIVDNYPEQ